MRDADDGHFNRRRRRLSSPRDQTASIAQDAVTGRATVTDHARREVKSGAIEYL
jgi:hypothetical protein